MIEHNDGNKCIIQLYSMSELTIKDIEPEVYEALLSTKSLLQSLLVKEFVEGDAIDLLLEIDRVLHPTR